MAVASNPAAPVNWNVRAKSRIKPADFLIEFPPFALGTITVKLNYHCNISHSKRYKAFYVAMQMKILCASYFCEIVLTLQHQPKSFNDILRDIKINPSTLNRRIKELTRYNLIEPLVVRVNEENRIKYRLTKKGERLIKDFTEFVRLSEKLEKAIME